MKINPLFKNFVFVVLIILVIGGIFSLLYFPASTPTQVSVTQLVSDINSNSIKKIETSGDTLNITYTNNKTATSMKETGTGLTDLLINLGVNKDSLAKIAAAEPKAAPKAEPHYGPCPVLVKASYLTGGGANNAIIVSLKNTSKKKIDAVKLTWTVYNHAGKAIGNSGGMAKKNLAKGRAGSYSWSVNAPNGTKAKAAVAYVHFADGTVWATK